MKRKNLYFLLPLLLLALSACRPLEQKIKILVTTDIHGAFFPTDTQTGDSLPGSLAAVYSIVKAEREKPLQEVVLLDNGDIIQGDPVVYYFNFEKTDTTHLCAQIMNFMKYDAATVGNHDIEAGHPVYDRLVQESRFPWMAANAVRTDNAEPYFRPYTIMKKGRVKIAVLGLVTPAIPQWLPPDIWAGMEFHDMVESAAYWAGFIEEEEKPDLLIGLFHAGLDYNYNNQDAGTPMNENATRLVAERVAGFDVIFCGHDHQTWNERLKGPDGDEVLILGSRSRARELAVADIIFSRKSGKWTIKNCEGENLQLDEAAPDPLFMAQFGAAHSEVADYVSKPLGRISRTISSRDAFFGPSAFIDLIHRVQLDISGADISFAAPLSFDTEIREGEITVGDMFKLYRYENLLYTMKLTGEEITGYLNYSYAGWFNTMNSESGHLLLFNQDESGRPRLSRPYYNFDSAMGIIYTVDVSKPAGQMVSILGMADVGGFDPEREYLVALNSYRGNGGGGHLTEGAGIPADELGARLVGTTGKDLRYYMMKWIENQKLVSPEPSGQWSVIPENLFQSGKNRDYPILFRN